MLPIMEHYRKLLYRKLMQGPGPPVASPLCRQLRGVGRERAVQNAPGHPARAASNFTQRATLHTGSASSASRTKSIGRGRRCGGRPCRGQERRRCGHENKRRQQQRDHEEGTRRKSNKVKDRKPPGREETCTATRGAPRACAVRGAARSPAPRPPGRTACTAPLSRLPQGATPAGEHSSRV